MPLFRSIGARKDATRGTTALEVRKGLEGLFTGPGVLPGAASPLVQGTAGFAYQLNTAHFVTRRATGDGVHLFGNDGAITVATGVAPGSGLSRIDVIWVRHPSNGENGDTDSVPVLGVTQGTAASIPVAPSIPTGALEIARNTMTSAATSTASAGNTIAQTAAVAAVRGSQMRRTVAARTSAVSIGNAVWTTLGAWTGSVVAAGLPASDFAVASTSITPGFTGWARVRTVVTFASSNVGLRRVRLMRNGQEVAIRTATPVSGANHALDVEWEGPVSDGDAITVEAFQSSGGSLGLEPANGGLTFYAERTA